jgi:hypothetical protein
MRAIFSVLLLANLGMFAWTHWFAPPETPPADPIAASVPRLVLAREQPATVSAQDARSTPTIAAAVVECVSIGPFSTDGDAQRAAEGFRSDGYQPQSRTAPGEVNDGFWVYVGGLDTQPARDRVMRRLLEGAISDAHEMTGAGNAGRISVGVFRDRSRAERRARLVSRLHLTPEIAERTRTGNVYWLDMSLRGADGALKPADLRALNQAGGRLSVQPCASAAAPGQAGPPAAASAPPAAAAAAR